VIINFFLAVVHVLASEANSPRALMEVFSLDAVRRLPNNPQYGPIYNLLELLYQGNVDDYKKFLDTEENLNNVKDIGKSTDSESSKIFKWVFIFSTHLRRFLASRGWIFCLFLQKKNNT
jgi:hypothetical protein